MTVHNWVRCHWRNGRHDLHDVPQQWLVQLESHIEANRVRVEGLGAVQLASLDAVELAWVECDVALGSGECGLTYRRARAIHALIRPTAVGGAWARHEVESLFSQRYGEPAERGLVAQHGALGQLEHPADEASAMGLFVGRQEPLPSELVPERPAASDVSLPLRMHSHDQPTSATLADVLPSLSRWVNRFSLVVPAATASADEILVEMISPAEDGPEASGSETDSYATPDEHGALFDLTTPRGDRPDAPRSSLSGLLGPSHTTQV